MNEERGSGYRMVILIGLVVGPLAGAEALVSVRATGDQVRELEEASVEILLDTTIARIQGWSYGVCHPEGLLTAIEARAGTDARVVDGGNPPWFEDIEIVSGGVTRALIIGLTVDSTLPRVKGFRDLEIIYRAGRLPGSGPDLVAAEVRPCHEEIGEPPVRAVYALTGRTFPLDLVAAAVEVSRLRPVFGWGSASHGVLAFDPANGIAWEPLEVTLRLDQAPDPIHGPLPVQGFSIALDVPETLVIDEVRPIGTLAAANGGEGPWFFDTGREDRCLWATTIVGEPGSRDAIDGGPVLALRVATAPARFQGRTEAVVVDLSFAAGCGIPPVGNVVAVLGERFEPQGVPGPGPSIRAVPRPGPTFIRGDVNLDGEVNIADPIYTLNAMFVGGPLPRCVEAADANDSRDLNIADPVRLLMYLFASSEPLPGPGPSCGLDPDPEGSLGCAEPSDVCPEHAPL